MKPLPLTVRVMVLAGLAATTLLGLIEVMVGAGLEATTVKVTEFEVPPPGEPLTTVIWAVPVAAKKLAGTGTCNCVLLMAVGGGNVVLFQRTSEGAGLGTKPLPLMVNVKSGPPAATLEGDKEAIAGTGL